jgi:carboxyl-terminal processing protease
VVHAFTTPVADVLQTAAMSRIARRDPLACGSQERILRAGVPFLVSRRFNLSFVVLSSFLVAALLAGAMKGRSAPADDGYKQLSVFAEVLSRIRSDYVEDPDLKSVTLGAINGLLESIDPFASYLSADQYKQHLKAKDRKAANVGLVLSKRYGYIGVVDSIPGSPAAKAGLNTGDMVETIKGVSTRDMPLAYAEMLLEGDAGSDIELTVLRVRRPESQKVVLTRAEIKYPAVEGKMVESDTGWIIVQSLEKSKAKGVASVIASLEKQGAKRLVLDLRDSATGSLEDGIALADLFLDKGTIAKLKGQRTSEQTFDAKPGTQITKLPLAVITNRGTAGAAEIAAAALLDNKRAEVIGERTYGDAAQRKAITLDDGSALILAVAKYHSPAGNSIPDKAVTPSVPMADQPEPVSDEEEDAAPADQPGEIKPRTADDPLLKKAIDVLINGVKKDAASEAPARIPDGEERGNFPPLAEPIKP